MRILNVAAVCVALSALSEVYAGTSSQGPADSRDGFAPHAAPADLSKESVGPGDLMTKLYVDSESGAAASLLIEKAGDRFRFFYSASDESLEFFMKFRATNFFDVLDAEGRRIGSGNCMARFEWGSHCSASVNSGDGDRWVINLFTWNYTTGHWVRLGLLHKKSGERAWHEHQANLKGPR